MSRPFIRTFVRSFVPGDGTPVPDTAVVLDKRAVLPLVPRNRKNTPCKNEISTEHSHYTGYPRCTGCAWKDTPPSLLPPSYCCTVSELHVPFALVSSEVLHSTTASSVVVLYCVYHCNWIVIQKCTSSSCQSYMTNLGISCINRLRGEVPRGRS